MCDIGFHSGSNCISCLAGLWQWDFATLPESQIFLSTSPNLARLGMHHKQQEEVGMALAVFWDEVLAHSC